MCLWLKKIDFYRSIWNCLNLQHGANFSRIQGSYWWWRWSWVCLVDFHQQCWSCWWWLRRTCGWLRRRPPSKLWKYISMQVCKYAIMKVWKYESMKALWSPSPQLLLPLRMTVTMSRRRWWTGSTGKQRPSCPCGQAAVAGQCHFSFQNFSGFRPWAQWRSWSRWCVWSRAAGEEVSACAGEDNFAAGAGPRSPRLGFHIKIPQTSDVSDSQLTAGSDKYRSTADLLPLPEGEVDEVRHPWIGFETACRSDLEKKMRWDSNSDTDLQTCDTEPPSERAASSEEIEVPLSRFWRRNTCFRFIARSRQLSRRLTWRIFMRDVLWEPKNVNLRYSLRTEEAPWQSSSLPAPLSRRQHEPNAGWNWSAASGSASPCIFIAVSYISDEIWNLRMII